MSIGQFYSVISDAELEAEFVDCLKTRNISQRLAYLGDSAFHYYEAYGDGYNKKNIDEDTVTYAKEKYYTILKDQIDPKQKNIFISLWCGNAHWELWMLERFEQDGIYIDYIGVDSSKAMLDLAHDRLQWLTNIKKTFLCADFMSPNFKEEIKNITNQYDRRIFGFLGWSFLNPNQTSLIDSLYNMLEPVDMMMFDVLGRHEDDVKVKMQVFNKYADYLSDPTMSKFMFSTLERVKIPFENGKLIIQTSEEPSIGAIKYSVLFQFTQKTVIKYRNELIHFLPGESIRVITFRNYMIDTLISFIEEHDFTIIHRTEKGLKGWRLIDSIFLLKLKS